MGTRVGALYCHIQNWLCSQVGHVKGGVRLVYFLLLPPSDENVGVCSSGGPHRKMWLTPLGSLEMGDYLQKPGRSMGESRRIILYPRASNGQTISISRIEGEREGMVPGIFR